MATEFMTVYWRDMLRFIRFRALLFSSLVQPALWMAFFGVAFTGTITQLGAPATVPPGGLSVPYLTFMAAGIMATAPVVVLAILIQRYLVRGLTMGAVVE